MNVCSSLVKLLRPTYAPPSCYVCLLAWDSTTGRGGFLHPITGIVKMLVSDDPYGPLDTSVGIPARDGNVGLAMLGGLSSHAHA